MTVLLRLTALSTRRANAAATAALYPNIEHVVVHNEGRSPLADLDRQFFLLDRPSAESALRGGGRACSNAIRERKLRIVLGGAAGNLGLSYDGMELLPELFRSGRWLRLWREASALLRHGRCAGAAFWPTRSVHGVRQHFGSGLIKIVRRNGLEFGDYTAIHPRRLDELDLRSPREGTQSGLCLPPVERRSGAATSRSAARRPWQFTKRPV